MQMKAESADYPESKGGDDSAQRYLERKNSFESIGKYHTVVINDHR